MPQKAQKYFVDAELTSMVCDSDEVSDEDEDTREKSLKVGGECCVVPVACLCLFRTKVEVESSN